MRDWNELKTWAEDLQHCPEHYDMPAEVVRLVMADLLALIEENAWLRADRACVREVLSQCTDSLHAEMLGKYHGQSPDDMHPRTRRDYDGDMEEIEQYRLAYGEDNPDG